MAICGGVRTRMHAVVACLATVVAGAAPAANAAAAAQILYFEPLDLRVEQRQLGARQKTSRPVERLTFAAFGREYALSVETNDVVHALGAAKPARSSLALYRGVIEGLAGSWVRLATHGTDVHGMLWDGADLYVIAPSHEVEPQLVSPHDRASGTVIFRLQDVLLPTHEGAACATGTKEQERGSVVYESLRSELSRASNKTGLGATLRLELSVLADALFASRYVDERAAHDSLLIRLNNIDGIYSSQLGVQIQPSHVEMLPADSALLSSTTDANALLRELSRARETTPRLNARGLTHLFTGRDLDGSTVGIGYIDALCSAKYGVALTEVSTHGTWYESLVAAHEIGHNFGAQHDGEPGSVCASVPQGEFLMSPRVNGSEAFSECSLQSIQPRIAAAECVRALPPANLRLAADLGTTRALVDTSFDYEIPVANVGGMAATNVRADVLMPPTLLVEDVYVIGGSCTSGAGVVQCYMGDITGGTSRSIYFTLRSHIVGTNTIFAEVSALNETDVSDNRASGTIAIEHEVDIAVSVDAPARVLAATPFAARFTVTNTMSSVANDVRTTIRLPPELAALNATLEGGDCTIGNAEITCLITRLPGGNSASGVLSLRAERVGPTTLRIATSGSYIDRVTANNVVETSIEVVATEARSMGRGNGGGGSMSVLTLAMLGLLGLWRASRAHGLRLDFARKRPRT
jgi:hypothetical protein